MDYDPDEYELPRGSSGDDGGSSSSAQEQFLASSSSGGGPNGAVSASGSSSSGMSAASSSSSSGRAPHPGGMRRDALLMGKSVDRLFSRLATAVASTCLAIMQLMADGARMAHAQLARARHRAAEAFMGSAAGEKVSPRLVLYVFP